MRAITSGGQQCGKEAAGGNTVCGPAVLSAAPSEDRGGHARQWTEQTLRAQGADVRISATVRVHRAGATSRLDDGASAALKDAFDALKHSPG